MSSITGSEFMQQETRDQSRVKARIVSTYFETWANIIGASTEKHLAYIDLYCGQGVAGDGVPSTPILILEKAVKNPLLSRRLVSLFNDVDPACIDRLRREIQAIDGIEKLAFPPVLDTQRIDSEIAAKLQSQAHHPTLLFIDPCGYKGLSLDLIESVLKDWACDCIFFFNYVRINAAISNPYLDEHVEALFGSDRIARLRASVMGKNVYEREQAIMEFFFESLRAGTSAKYVHAFRFMKEAERRTSHYLVFVSKSKKGYFKFKEIAARESTKRDQGVPSFTFDPREGAQLDFLEEPMLDKLASDLLKKFKGMPPITRKEIFESHSIGTRYIEANYGEALAILESQGKIMADPPMSKRRKLKGRITFGEKVKAIFPKAD